MGPRVRGDDVERSKQPRPRHCEEHLRRSNPYFLCCTMDCFAEFIIGRRFAPTRWLAMTTKHTFAISPHVLREVFVYFPPSPTRGRGDAGRPVRPIAACAEVVVERTRVSQVTPEITRHSPRDVLQLIRDLPGERLFCHRRLRKLPSANLTPAPRCQDHTISPSASAPFVIGASASTASRLASETIANRPSCEAGRLLI
jgi:hypothetical protein